MKPHLYYQQEKCLLKAKSSLIEFINLYLNLINITYNITIFIIYKYIFSNDFILIDILNTEYLINDNYVNKWSGRIILLT